MQSSELKFVSIFGNGRNLNLLQLSDAKLQTDDGCTFFIHRAILARSSEYFRALFCDMDTERRIFRIPGISGECLSDILCFVYAGDIQFTETNVKDLMIAADNLLLEDLRMKIKHNIKAYMTEFNCLVILQAAHHVSDKDIFQECFRFIQTRFERIMQCQKEDLADLPLEILRSILSNRNLYVYNETTVWQAIVAWTQKDVSLRKCCVPQLLLTLAMENMGEELATEILQHEIISKNSLMKDLVRSPNDFSTNLDVLLTFLSSYSNRFTEPNRHRIPLQLLVMWSDIGGEGESGNSNNLYITYDENPDLWRKVTEVSSEPDVLIAIGHNVYFFKTMESTCMSFDLSAMDWVTMESFRHEYVDFLVVATDACIYVLGETFDGEEHFDQKTYVEVYDTENNRWFGVASLRNMSLGAAVAIDENIYAVGHSGCPEGMMMQMFDPIMQKWSCMSPPTFYRSTFTMVAYHQRIYLIGDSDLNTEVFDPTTNLWEGLPDLPYPLSSPNAVVFNDQIIVDDVRWNNAKNCWEEFNETNTLKCLQLHRFCTIDDVETIRKITKQNRDPEAQMKKILFN